MTALIPILLCIIFGMSAGFIGRNNAPFHSYADKTAMVAIYMLLFVLGAELGSNQILLASLGNLGVKAFTLALCCSGGSVLALSLAGPLFPRSRDNASGSARKHIQSASPIRGSLRILTFFILGIFLGWQGFVPAWLAQGAMAEYLLWLLVLAVGIGLGKEIEAFAILKEMHLRLLAVPLLIIAGTIAGAAVGSLFLPGMQLAETISVGTGFGYYSLSSLLIGKAGYPALASIALLTNIFREILGIITAPILVRYAGPLAPIAVAGATAMDTGLPAIARYSGEEYAIIAVFSGVFLTLCVPFLVALAVARIAV